MSFICLAPGKEVGRAVLEAMENCLQGTFGLPTRRLGVFPEPSVSYDSKRDQYSSSDMLQVLAAIQPPDAVRVLGITERDIFIPMLSFIFGQAQLGGRIALISLARLRQTFYGLPPDPELLMKRACKEAIHELGHTFGLTHCLDQGCAMSLSTAIQQVDSKAQAFCGNCRTLLHDRFKAIGMIPKDGGHAEDHT
ncbi:MAG: archaemetzincin family Zn-dependent metalloprotease [Candidatus Eisenbacteria sp.]|nr:archaemetzincin family Zn-dependent metalloprotease [Candidatus Eisenbacteria bacterium]